MASITTAAAVGAAFHAVVTTAHATRPTTTRAMTTAIGAWRWNGAGRLASPAWGSRIEPDARSSSGADSSVRTCLSGRSDPLAVRPSPPPAETAWRSVPWLSHAAPRHASAGRLADRRTGAHPAARASAARAGRGRQPDPVPHVADLLGQPRLPLLDAQPVREPGSALPARPARPNRAAGSRPMVAACP